MHISGSVDVPWDSVEIQQIIKEQAEIQEPQEETSVKTDEISVLTTDEKVQLKKTVRQMWKYLLKRKAEEDLATRKEDRWK